MLIHPRLAIAVLGAKLTGARARATSFARAARRTFSDGIVCGVGIAATVLAALSALLCVTGCPAPTPANGAIAAVWSLGSVNAAVSCDSVGARFVALRIRNRASGVITATAFPCPNASGTAQLAPGLYDVSFQLDAADGTRLAVAPDQRGVSVVSGRVTILAPVAFTVGASPQTTVKNQETLATSLEPGSYLVRARGKGGAIDCWQRDDTIDVPAAGGTVSRTLGLLPDHGPAC